MNLNIRCLIFLILTLSGIIAYGNSSSFKTQQIIFPDAEYITENTIRIPFSLADHLIVIKASVNGQKGNFIIDTGAESLILNKVHFNDFYDHRSRSTSGVSSTVDKTILAKIDKLTLNTFKIKNIDSDVIDLSHIEKRKKEEILGIIGFNILKNYEIFIDFYLKQITLFKTTLSGNRIDKEIFLEEIADSVSFKLKKHTIVLNCFVNNEKVNFGLDTGAEINQLSSQVSKKVKQNFRIVRRVKMLGAGKGEKQVLAGKLYNVKLNNRIYCGVMRTILTNLSGMESAYGTKLDGILGYEFIAMKRIIINYKKEKLYFVTHPYVKN